MDQGTCAAAGTVLLSHATSLCSVYRPPLSTVVAYASEPVRDTDTSFAGSPTPTDWTENCSRGAVPQQQQQPVPLSDSRFGHHV